MSNVNEMKSQLATIKAKRVVKPTKDSAPDVQSDDMSFLEGTAVVLGAVPSATKGFFANIGTSYKYHEAKRKGLI